MTTTTTPVLDWSPDPLVRPQHRQRYAVGHHADVTAPLTAVRLPLSWPTLQQHNEGACTTFAGAHAANTLRLVDAPATVPVGADPDRRELPGGLPTMLTEDDARAAYDRAQDLDDRPGRDYVGTSVLAAMLAGREAGWWAGFLWAHGTRQIAQALSQLQRPVIVGVPWLDGMWATDAEGRVTVEGSFVGGHALEVYGFDPAHSLFDGTPGFDWLNSQDGYGLSGRGSISARDLGWLLANRGEAAVPVRCLPCPDCQPIAADLP